MSEFGGEQGPNHQQTTPIEPAPRPTPERRPDMAHRIDYGELGGTKGVLARIRERLKALGGVKEIPLEELTDEKIALAMERSADAHLAPGRKFNPQNVAEWLGYNWQKTPPQVYHRIGDFLGRRVLDQSLGLVPDELAEPHAPPNYTVLDSAVFLRVAHPQPVQQAKPA